MTYSVRHIDYVSREARLRAGRAISRTKKGVPMSDKNRQALRAYWESKRGVISKKRNGYYISCPVCTNSVYKNQRDLRRVKNNFCSTKCVYKFRDHGKTTENEKIRDSKEYIAWRKHVFQRDDFTCQGCGERGDKLIADHELSFSQFPALRFEILNGRTLCNPCHLKTPNYGARALSSVL